jgi:hypothetical protein
MRFSSAIRCKKQLLEVSMCISKLRIQLHNITIRTQYRASTRPKIIILHGCRIVTIFTQRFTTDLHALNSSIRYYPTVHTLSTPSPHPFMTLLKPPKRAQNRNNRRSSRDTNRTCTSRRKSTRSRLCRASSRRLLSYTRMRRGLRSRDARDTRRARTDSSPQWRRSITPSRDFVLD